MSHCLFENCNRVDNKGAFGFCGLHYKRFKRSGDPDVLKRDNTQLNHSIFETIDSEEKAYWLGFLLADGSIQVRKNVQKIVKLALAIEDKEHLEKFKKFVNSKLAI